MKEHGIFRKGWILEDVEGAEKCQDMRQRESDYDMLRRFRFDTEGSRFKGRNRGEDGQISISETFIHAVDIIWRTF